MLHRLYRCRDLPLGMNRGVMAQKHPRGSHGGASSAAKCGRLSAVEPARRGHFFFAPEFAAYSKAARGVTDCGMPMMSRREIRLVAQPAITAALRPKVGIAYTW